MSAFNDIDQFISFVEKELITGGLDAGTLFRTSPAWSSLNALILISRISEETGVLISSADLAGMQTLEDIFQFVKKRSDGAG